MLVCISLGEFAKNNGHRTQNDRTLSLADLRDFSLEGHGKVQNEEVEPPSLEIRPGL